MDSWFPLARMQIENDDFRVLTPTEKLYFWLLLSEFNFVGGRFYKSDIWFAAALDLSLEKIRKARAKIAKLGWIDMTPGTQDKRGRKIATPDTSVKWATVDECDRFAQIDRPTFERLIDLIRAKKLTHEDVVCWVYISYLVWLKGGEYLEIKKSELCGITNIPRTVKCLENVQKSITFSGSKHLFKLIDRYRAIRIEDVWLVAFSQETSKSRYLEIENSIKLMRKR